MAPLTPAPLLDEIGGTLTAGIRKGRPGAGLHEVGDALPRVYLSEVRAFVEAHGSRLSGLSRREASNTCDPAAPDGMTTD